MQSRISSIMRPALGKFRQISKNYFVHPIFFFSTRLQAVSFVSLMSSWNSSQVPQNLIHLRARLKEEKTQNEV